MRRYLHIAHHKFQGITEHSILTARDAGNGHVTISADGCTLVTGPLKDLEAKGIAWVSTEYASNAIDLDERMTLGG